MLKVKIAFRDALPGALDYELPFNTIKRGAVANVQAVLQDGGAGINVWIGH